MKLHIESEISYEIDVFVKTKERQYKERLEEEGCLDLSIDGAKGQELSVTFEDVEESWLVKIAGGIIKAIFNFIYYCMSYDDFEGGHPLGTSSNYIKMVIRPSAISDEDINLCFKTVTLSNSVELDMGVVREKTMPVRYELDEVKYFDSYKKWIKESVLYMIPGVVVCIAGIVISAIRGNYFFIVFFLAVTMGLIFLICQFVKDKEKKMESSFASLGYQIRGYKA